VLRRSVELTPKSGQSTAAQYRSLWAKSDISHCGRLVAKAQAELSESELLRAMFDIGYFPPNTPRPVA
jgi:hypothetical protein